MKKRMNKQGQFYLVAAAIGALIFLIALVAVYIYVAVMRRRQTSK